MNKNAKRARNTVFPIAMSLAMVIGILPMSMTANEDGSVVEKSTFGTMATPTDSQNEATPSDISVQDLIDELPAIEDFRSTQREEVKLQLTAIREEMETLSEEEIALLDTTKLVNLETAVLMIANVEYYAEDVKASELLKTDVDAELVFEDLGDRIFARPNKLEDNLFIFSVAVGTGEKIDVGKRNERLGGFSQNKNDKNVYKTRLMVGPKLVPLHIRLKLDQVDGTWGESIKFPILNEKVGDDVDLIPEEIFGEVIENYSFYTIVAQDSTSKGAEELDMKAAGLSGPDTDGKIHWHVEYTRESREAFIYYYYKMARNVQYDANGGIGEMPSEQYVSYEKVTLADNLFTRNGYEFVGWNTSADGTGTHYDANAVFKMPLVETLTLYAQWNKEEDPYIPPVDPRPDPTPDPEPEEPEEEIEEEVTPETGGEEEEIEEETTPEVGGDEEEIEEEVTPEVGNKDEVTDTGVASTLPWLFGLMTSAIVAVAELFRRKK